MTAFDGLRTSEDPGIRAAHPHWLWIGDAVCFVLCLVNSIAWPVILFLLIGD